MGEVLKMPLNLNQQMVTILMLICTDLTIWEDDYMWSNQKIVFTYFTKEQVLILENKEISNWEEGTYIIIQNFVDVSFENINIKKSNISKTREDNQLEPIKELLREYFAAYNQQLFDLIGKKYNW